MDPQGKYQTKDGKLTDKGRYQRLVGKLIYLSHTRPDISFAVGMVSRYMSQPTEDHQEAVFRILQYLKQNPRQGLFFGKTTNQQVRVFTYADWGGSRTDGRSTTGYCSYVWGNLVTWRSNGKAKNKLL